MLSSILLIGCCAVLASSAPAVEKQQEQVKALPAELSQSSGPVLLFGPEQQQQQFQYQQAFRLQQPLIQSLTPFGRIQGPNEQSMVLFYPNTPLSPLPTSQNSPLLRQQDNPAQIFFDQFWGFIQQRPGGNGSSSASLSLALTKPSNLELEPEAEEIPKQPQLPQLTPASTIPLPNYPNNFIYYTISGTPQFYGNFDYLRNPQSPFFRWPETDKEQRVLLLNPIKEINKDDESKVQPIPALESSSSAIKAAPTSSEEFKIVPGEAAKRFSQFLTEQKIFQPQPILIRSDFFDKSLGKSELKNEENKSSRILEGIVPKEEASPRQQQLTDDLSIAHAHPVAVAVTAKGGLARSVPLATAIVGNKGIALSAPEATSISGDFQDTGDSAKSGVNRVGINN